MNAQGATASLGMNEGAGVRVAILPHVVGVSERSEGMTQHIVGVWGGSMALECFVDKDRASETSRRSSQQKIRQATRFVSERSESG
jgi:hypothetical protein